MEVDIMKPSCFFTVVFLAAGICSVAAQDLIVLRDGDIIEAKVTELSPAEIRYKRFDHLDGPTIVIPANNVLSIRYENGRVEKINAASGAGQKNTQIENPRTTAMATNKFIFGINANGGGALGYIWEGGPGAGINIELGKGHFNSEINLMAPRDGFGFLFTFNYFWPSRIGGAYLGAGTGFAFFGYYRESSYEEPYEESYQVWTGSSYRTEYRTVYDIAFSIPLGLNVGYKFVTKSGLYFRTGTFVGFDFGGLIMDTFPVYIKPDLAIGWTMR